MDFINGNESEGVETMGHVMNNCIEMKWGKFGLQSQEVQAGAQSKFMGTNQAEDGLLDVVQVCGRKAAQKIFGHCSVFLGLSKGRRLPKPLLVSLIKSQKKVIARGAHV